MARRGVLRGQRAKRHGKGGIRLRKGRLRRIIGYVALTVGVTILTTLTADAVHYFVILLAAALL